MDRIRNIREERKRVKKRKRRNRSKRRTQCCKQDCKEDGEKVEEECRSYIKRGTKRRTETEPQEDRAKSMYINTKGYLLLYTYPRLAMEANMERKSSKANRDTYALTQRHRNSHTGIETNIDRQTDRNSC